MITALFNRSFPLMTALTLGSLALVYQSIAMATADTSTLNTVLLAAAVALYGIVLFCRVVPWYKKEDRSYGIEEHFGHTFLIAVYPFLIFHGLFILTNLTLFLVIELFPLTFTAATNGIVLSYHFRDPSLRPPGYHQRGLYTDKVVQK